MYQIKLTFWVSNNNCHFFIIPIKMYTQYHPISFKMDKLSDNKISTNPTEINQTITKVH